jgi:hypothetical protein
MISLESNQPTCSPRSSASCSAPMPIASAAKPNQSNFSRVFGGLSSMKRKRPTVAIRPKGTLTRNTQCQEYWSVSHAPSVGPMIGPSMMPMPKIDCALVRSCAG